MSPDPPMLPFLAEPGLRGNEVISLLEDMTECRRPPPDLEGTMRPPRGTLYKGPEVGMFSGGRCICSHSRRTEPSLLKTTFDISAEEAIDLTPIEYHTSAPFQKFDPILSGCLPLRAE